jgi:hypothetical protein
VIRAARKGLTVCLLGSSENGRNFYEMIAMTRDEDNAPMAGALAVPPLPLRALERFHVAAKWVFRHFIEAFEDEAELVARNLFKLFGGAFGQLDGPGHDAVEGA